MPASSQMHWIDEFHTFKHTWWDISIHEIICLSSTCWVGEFKFHCLGSKVLSKVDTAVKSFTSHLLNNVKRAHTSWFKRSAFARKFSSPLAPWIVIVDPPNFDVDRDHFTVVVKFDFKSLSMKISKLMFAMLANNFFWKLFLTNWIFKLKQNRKLISITSVIAMKRVADS